MPLAVSGWTNWSVEPLLLMLQLIVQLNPEL